MIMVLIEFFSVKEFCNNLFFDILNVQASHLFKDVREPEDDLQPVPEFFGVLTQLVCINDLYFDL